MAGFTTSATKLTPQATALLAELRTAALSTSAFHPRHLEPMRELYALGLADLAEPPPYEWRLTHAGKAYGDPDV